MRSALLLLVLAIFGCTSSTPAPQAPAGPVAETTSPKDSPLAYRVLQDTSDKAANTVEFHVLISPTKHDEVQKLLEFLYRHLMQRRESAPAGLAGHVYSDEAQYKTPPRTPVASIIQKPGDVGPSFDNKVPLEFWQQIEEALDHGDRGWKLEKKIERDDARKTLRIVVPYTEPGKDEWAETLSFNLAMNVFTDTTQALFDKVPELSAMEFVGRHQDKEVVKISMDRSTYHALKLNEIEEQMGQLHGRAFLELATNRGSDAQISKANAKRMAGVYKKMLGQLKGRAVVSSALK